jgi:hypothetical protein
VPFNNAKQPYTKTTGVIQRSGTTFIVRLKKTYAPASKNKK